MKRRKRASARVPLDRIERLFAHQAKLKRQLDRVDFIIGTLLLRLSRRNTHTVDIARRLARVLGEPATSLARIDGRLRQARVRARRRRAPATALQPATPAPTGQARP